LTTVASNGEVNPERTFEAAVVGFAAVTMLSLIAIGLPASESMSVCQRRLSTLWSLSSRTSLSSNGIFDLVDGCFEPTGLLLRAHMVLISLCAQEESVPRSV
jgi:hypothetical protein